MIATLRHLNAPILRERVGVIKAAVKEKGKKENSLKDTNTSHRREV